MTSGRGGSGGNGGSTGERGTATPEPQTAADGGATGQRRQGLLGGRAAARARGGAQAKVERGRDRGAAGKAGARAPDTAGSEGAAGARTAGIGRNGRQRWLRAGGSAGRQAAR